MSPTIFSLLFAILGQIPAVAKVTSGIDMGTVAQSVGVLVTAGSAVVAAITHKGAVAKAAVTGNSK